MKDGVVYKLNASPVEQAQEWRAPGRGCPGAGGAIVKRAFQNP